MFSCFYRQSLLYTNLVGFTRKPVISYKRICRVRILAEHFLYDRMQFPIIQKKQRTHHFVLCFLSSVVQKKGVEPSRYCYHTDLNRARLPIPPLLQTIVPTTQVAVSTICSISHPPIKVNYYLNYFVFLLYSENHVIFFKFPRTYPPKGELIPYTLTIPFDQYCQRITNTTITNTTGALYPRRAFIVS